VPLSPPVANIKYPPLLPIRLAEPFERLREASDRMLARTGSRPKVFLANLGTVAEFTARASFAKTFFEAGGIEAVSNDGFASRDAMIAALKASGAKLACVCSTDEVYSREAADAAKALAQAGATHIYLAGRPKEGDALKAPGVGTFIFAGCDALATLKTAHDVLGRQ
jgi:methylmalonyl-CoA mutase